jgi:hypothetical protein
VAFERAFLEHAGKFVQPWLITAEGRAAAWTTGP